MLKLCTVGTSWITESFIEGAKSAGDIEITACYSRDKTKAKEFAEKHGAKYSFCDIKEAAESDCFDAVYIASPNVFHYSQSKLFLENNKNVIVEKPATTTSEEYEELMRLAEKKNLVYCEAIMSIHTPSYTALSEAIKTIGKIKTVNLVYCQLSSKYKAYTEGKNPNIFNPAMHTGCLMDIGVYNLYVAAALFGKADKIISDSSFLESGADSNGTAILSYGDMTVNLVYSKVGQSYSPSEIIGDKGTITIDSVSQLSGIDLIHDGERRNIVEYNIPRNIVMSAEAAFFRNMVTEKDFSSENYTFARKCAQTVREMCDTIRKQNNFPF